MKLVKKIGFLIFFLVVLLPVGNVFAEVVTTPTPNDYAKGIFDLADYEIIPKENGSIEEGHKFLDNDLETGTIFTSSGKGTSYIIKFKTPLEISGYYINGTGNTNYSKILISYYDDSGNSKETQTITRKLNPGYYDLNVSNVYQVDIGYDYNFYNYTLKELEFFGGFDTSETIPSIDSDGDGIPDSEDEYPDDPTNTPPEPDRDGDGIPDNEDEYPDDPTNTPPEPETPEELPEVKNLTVETTEKRADLSWDNPPLYFDKAIIYRKTLGTTQTASVFDYFKPMTVSAAEDYKPLFETNGTQFSDLTVDSETEYEYKVTTSFNGMESPGVVVKTSIPKPPLVDTSELELPFSAKDLITSGNGLLALIGGFVLLALAFIFVPKLIALIRGANNGSSGNNTSHNESERIGKQPRITERQMDMAVGNGRSKREARMPRLRERQIKGG